MTEERDETALRAFIRRMRELRGWSATELAERSGIKPRTLIAWESGASEDMMTSRFVKVLRALGVSAAILDRLGGSATAADGAAVAEATITRLELAARLRADPANVGAREQYVRWRYGELIVEGYDVAAAKAIVDHELSALASSSSSPGQGGA